MDTFWLPYLDIKYIFFLYDNGNIDSYVLFVVWLTELV